MSTHNLETEEKVSFHVEHPEEGDTPDASEDSQSDGQMTSDGASVWEWVFSLFR